MKNKLINILNQEGQLVVTSREVAENFEKEHNDVKKRVRELIRDMGEISHNYFIKNEYKDSLNRTQEEYLLTRDGFSLLVMGFTGAKALAWKLKYIEAFNKMEEALKNQYTNLSPEVKAIFALDIKQQEIERKVITIANDFEEFKNETPLFNIECDELLKSLKKKGVDILGGYKSPAYNNRSLRGKVYSDIQGEIKRNFGLRSYKAIKRSQIDVAHRIIQEYKAPICLVEEIDTINNQIALNEIAATRN